MQRKGSSCKSDKAHREMLLLPVEGGQPVDAETHTPNGEEKLGVGSNRGKRLKVSEVLTNAH